MRWAASSWKASFAEVNASDAPFSAALLAEIFLRDFLKAICESSQQTNLWNCVLGRVS